MSRRLDMNSTDYKEIIDDPKLCRWLIDEVCCNGDCKPMVADFPDTEEYCPTCPHFTEEDHE